MVCTLSATQASRLQTLLFIILKIMVLALMAREYLIRVCTYNVGERPVSLPSSVLSLFGVSYTLLSVPLALAFFAAPFSHGLKALVSK